MGIKEDCQRLFQTDDLYKVLNLEKSDDLTEANVKKAYYEASLLFHPDKGPLEGGNSESSEKFKLLSKVYTILVDKEKRKVYDDSGEVPNSLVFESNYDWYSFWGNLYKRDQYTVTTDDIKSFEENYKGSVEERDDLKRHYNEGDGSLDYIIDNLLCAGYEDEDRLVKLLKEMIAAGELVDNPNFSSSSESAEKAKARKTRAEKEAKELANAEQSQSNGQPSLEDTIKANAAERSAEMVASLEEKYGGSVGDTLRAEGRESGEDAGSISTERRLRRVRLATDDSSISGTSTASSGSSELLHSDPEDDVVIDLNLTESQQRKLPANRLIAEMERKRTKKLGEMERNPFLVMEAVVDNRSEVDASSGEEEERRSTPERRKDDDEQSWPLLAWLEGGNKEEKGKQSGIPRRVIKKRVNPIDESSQDQIQPPLSVESVAPAADESIDAVVPRKIRRCGSHTSATTTVAADAEAGILQHTNAASLLEWLPMSMENPDGWSKQELVDTMLELHRRYVAVLDAKSAKTEEEKDCQPFRSQCCCGERFCSTFHDPNVVNMRLKARVVRLELDLKEKTEELRVEKQLSAEYARRLGLATAAVEELIGATKEPPAHSVIGQMKMGGDKTSVDGVSGSGESVNPPVVGNNDDDDDKSGPIAHDETK